MGEGPDGKRATVRSGPRLRADRGTQAKGTSIPNFTSAQLEEEITPEREELVKNAASSLYSGGADTVRRSTSS